MDPKRWEVDWFVTVTGLRIRVDPETVTEVFVVGVELCNLLLLLVVTKVLVSEVVLFLGVL